jgi:tetratricopeptide (TPR) repeat protein
MVRVADDQAAFALREKRDRQARKYLERADREAKSPNLLDKDDLAALTAMHGLLALNEGDPSRAVESYRRALALWTESHGQQYLATAWVTILLGQAQALNGQYSEGARTMEKGLVLTKATSGESSSRYLAAEMAYAKVLDRMGQNSRAATLRQDVATKQAALNAGSCRNCTVSVVALH